MRTKPPIKLQSDDLDRVDSSIRRILAEHQLPALTVRGLAGVRDIFLAGMNEAAERAQDTAAGSDDPPEHKTAATEAAYRALADFAEITQALVDRLRAEGDLPERPGKTTQDAFREALKEKSGC